MVSTFTIKVDRGVEKSQSPWRVFWFPLSLAYDFCLRQEEESQSPWRVFWFPRWNVVNVIDGKTIVAIPLAGLLVSTSKEEAIERLKNSSRNPLGGSFGFHSINCH